ncbi:hypothetical protein QO002_005668 [Pararhizobium capsulatum DSM 1112]|uniref:Uncharacterized protein n=1 Tax=Pararhizobium capsulatum DSM 1112 TaxID=1121113 RepID=A0ABU0BZS9_9HYPH|nr:hypothetical protein [Pararhizobium capsulatum]MDQ0323462.1 hypothetical protein [Pararhizobium capsulatum DSM 1112]
MDEIIEDLLAAQAAQSVVVTTLLRLVLNAIREDDEGEIRRTLLSKWNEEGAVLLDSNVFVGLSPEGQARVVEKSKVRMTEILATAHKSESTGP